MMVQTSKQSLIARNTHAYTPLHWATHEQLTYMEISTQLKTERVLRNLTTHNDINVTNNPSSLGILTHRNLTTHGGINVTNNPSSLGILTHRNLATHGGINVTNNSSSRGILTHHSFVFCHCQTSVFNCTGIKSCTADVHGNLYAAAD